MSTQIKLIIPLIEGFAKKDFDVKSGFVDAYLHNKNRPDLCSNLFLMYEGDNISLENAQTFSKFLGMKELRSQDTKRIGGKHYRIYTFDLVGKKLRSLLRGIPSFDTQDKIKTLNFWGTEDTSINKLLFGEDPLLSMDTSSVPEEDYCPPDTTKTSGYKESLAYLN